MQNNFELVYLKLEKNCSSIVIRDLDSLCTSAKDSNKLAVAM